MLTWHNMDISTHVSSCSPVCVKSRVMCVCVPLSPCAHVQEDITYAYTLYTMSHVTYTNIHREDDAACHVFKTNSSLLIHFYFFPPYFVILLI